MSCVEINNFIHKVKNMYISNNLVITCRNYMNAIPTSSTYVPTYIQHTCTNIQHTSVQKDINSVDANCTTYIHANCPANVLLAQKHLATCIA